MPRQRIVFDPSTAVVMTRRQAINARERRYYTGQPCVHGHLALRYTSTGGCYECLRPAPPWNDRGDDGFDYRVTVQLRQMQGIGTPPAFYRAIELGAQRAALVMCKLALENAATNCRYPGTGVQGDERARLGAKALELEGRIPALDAQIMVIDGELSKTEV